MQTFQLLIFDSTPAFFQKASIPLYHMHARPSSIGA